MVRGRGVGFWLAIFSAAAGLCATPGWCESEDAAVNLKENQGLLKIQAGEIREGLALMREAARELPKDAGRHMNLGSMLFAVGSERYQEGERDIALPLLNEAKSELETAAELMGEKEPVLKGHCLYLLGDLAFHVFDDKPGAKRYYELALQHYPEHGGAAQALKNFDAGQESASAAGAERFSGVQDERAADREDNLVNRP